MAKRQNFSTGSIYEERYGYSRVVRVGETVYISGTIGFDYATGKIPDDPVDQLNQIIANWQKPLADAGTSINDIVQLTIFITGTDVFEAIGTRMGQIFGDIRPTNTTVIAQFPIPGAKIEIQAIAVAGCGG